MNVVAPVLIPAVLAGVVWLVSFRLWNRHAPAEHGHWGGAAAFGTGYLAGHVALLSWPALPPSTADQWLVCLAVPFGIVAATERWWGARWWSSLPVRAILIGVVLFLLSGSLYEYRWETRQSVLWTGGGVLAVLFCSEALERLGRRRSGIAIPGVLWLVTVGVSVSLVFTGSAMLGQLAGVLAAILGAAGVLSLWAPTMRLAWGAVGVWYVLLAGLLWQGHFYSELGMVSAACFLIAPLGAWVAEIPVFTHRSVWTRAGARLVAVAIPVGIGLFLAWRYWSAIPEEYVY